MSKKRLKSNALFLSEVLPNATLHKTVDNVDRLTTIVEDLKDIVTTVAGAYKLLLSRVEEIEARIEEGAPVCLQERSGTPRTDRRESDHHLTIV